MFIMKVSLAKNVLNVFIETTYLFKKVVFGVLKRDGIAMFKGVILSMANVTCLL